MARASQLDTGELHYFKADPAAIESTCVLVYARGQWTVGSMDQRPTSRIGDVLLGRVRADAPQIELKPDHSLKIEVARALLDRRLRLRNGTPLEDLRIEGSAARMLAAHAEAANAYKPYMAADTAVQLELETLRLVMDCLRSACRSSASKAPGANDGWRPSRRHWFHLVWWHIETHLGSRTMTPATICADLGISRSALYRHFSPAGGLARYIRNRRLDTVQTLIKDQQPPYSVKMLANQSGLRNAGQLSRLFERKFGHCLAAAVHSVKAADH